MLPVTIKLTDQLTAVISRRRDLEREFIELRRIGHFRLIFWVDLDAKSSFFDFGILITLTSASGGCFRASKSGSCLQHLRCSYAYFLCLGISLIALIFRASKLLTSLRSSIAKATDSIDPWMELSILPSHHVTSCSTQSLNFLLIH